MISTKSYFASITPFTLLFDQLPNGSNALITNKGAVQLTENLLLVPCFMYLLFPSNLSQLVKSQKL